MYFLLVLISKCARAFGYGLILKTRIRYSAKFGNLFAVYEWLLVRITDKLRSDGFMRLYANNFVEIIRTIMHFITA